MLRTISIFILRTLAAIAIILLLHLLGGCSSTKSSLHYSPPSAAPLRKAIASGQSSNAGAIAKAGDLSAMLTRAQTLLASGKDPSALLRELSAMAVDARKQIDGLTTELLDTQKALVESQSEVNALEQKVKVVTDAGNQCVDDKNTLQARDEKLTREIHKLKLVLCSLGAAAAFLFVFQFRRLLALAGPWGIIGGFAGAPAIAFAFLWFKL